MKDRLLQLLDLEHLSPSKFADLIGVQRSSVSHVISGRNNPSYDFLQKTLKSFPGLQADWLMLGEGPIYEKMGRTGPGDLFAQQEPDDSQMHTEPEPPAPVSESGSADTFGFEPATTPDNHSERKDSQDLEDHREGGGKARKAVRVMIFYDDDTFSSHMPSQ